MNTRPSNHQIARPSRRQRAALYSVLALLLASSAVQAQCPTQKLLANGGAQADHFATAVAIDGDVAVVTARGAGAGAAYVFRFNGTTWVEEQRVDRDEGTWTGFFGTMVAVSGDVFVVSCPLDDEAGPNHGAAYVYRYDGTTWVEEQKLMATDGGSSDSFGSDVAIDDDVIVVTAPNHDTPASNTGAAYVYRYDGENWLLDAKLSPADATNDDSLRAVALSGDLAVFGAIGDDDNGSLSGSAYVFAYDGTSWVEQEKLLPSDGTAGARFGQRVSLTDNVAVVGAPYDPTSGPTMGSAYVFRFDGTDWIEEQKLTAFGAAPADAVPEERFGAHIAIDGDFIGVGVVWEFYAVEPMVPGVAYAYRFDGTQWNGEARLTPPDALPSSDPYVHQGFGLGVAVHGETMLVSSSRDHAVDLYAGSAYVYDFGPAPFTTEFVRGDCNDDGTVNVADAICGLGYLFDGGGVSCADAADTNNDGTVDIADPISILALLFAAGPEPATPYPDCGPDPDPVEDALCCVNYSSCP